MADEDRVRHWARVVDKSTLEVIITGTTQTTSVTASVDWLDSVNNTDEEIVDTVNGDPFTLNMRSPRSYSLDLLLHFVTDATATVRVRVAKPGGDTHGKPFEMTLTSKADADEFFSFFVMTRQ
jgi:hypothetical protein